MSFTGRVGTFKIGGYEPEQSRQYAERNAIVPKGDKKEGKDRKYDENRDPRYEPATGDRILCPTPPLNRSAEPVIFHFLFRSKVHVV